MPKIAVEVLVEGNDERAPLGGITTVDTEKLPVKLLYTKIPFANGDIRGFVSITLRNPERKG